MLNCTDSERYDGVARTLIQKSVIYDKTFTPKKSPDRDGPRTLADIFGIDEQ